LTFIAAACGELLMKPWIVETAAVAAGLTLAFATLAGAMAMSALRVAADTPCAPPSFALTLAFEPRIGPVTVLAGVAAAAPGCAESAAARAVTD